MIRSHPNVRRAPLLSGAAAMLLGFSGVCELMPTAALAQTVAPVQGAEDGMEARTHEDIYQDYNRAGLELSPLYQIQSWLGYLKLHPDTPYRDLVRWKLRYLAAALTGEQEDLLLAMLALEGLTDQINAIGDAKLKVESVSDYLLQHPAIGQSPPHRAVLEEMLRRLDVEAPAQFIAKALNERPLVATNTAQATPFEPAQSTTATNTMNQIPTSDAAKDLEEPGSSRVETQGAQGAGSGQNAGISLPDPLATAPNTPSTTGSGTTGSDGLAGPGEQPDTGNASPSSGRAAAATAVASIPRTTTHAPEAAYTGLVRLHRWKAGMSGLSEESQRQMWATYLLLYPDGPEAKEAEEELKKANEAYEVARREKALHDEALAAELERGRAYQEQVADMERKLARRQTLMVIGTVLLGLVLFTGL